MGIRVKKTVGWGIPDLITDDRGNLVDPRFDSEAFRDMGEGAYEVSYPDFVEWVAQHQDRLKELLHLDDAEGVEWWLTMERFRLKQKPSYNGRWTPLDSIYWGDEFLDSDVLQIIPPCMFSEWFRRDDTIDFIEETNNHRQQNRAELLKGCGIYPYSSGWLRFRDPVESMWEDAQKEHMTPGDELGPTKLTPATYAQLVGTWSEEMPPMAQSPLLEHLQQDWRPKLPSGVVITLLYFEKCFPLGIESMMNDLRPMLYVYWS